MGFSVQLAQDLIEVEAGGNSPVSISVTNKSEVTDRFELEIEGLDIEWKAVPVPMFSVEPGETRSERAFLKPPRVSESVAGNYPFVVRVRSLESGEQKTVQGVLQLKPYHYLTMEIDPKKGLYSWSTHRNVFEIQLVNLGNTDHTLQLVGSDPEDACAYEFDSEVITLSPGQQKEVSVKVSPVSSSIFAGNKLIGFSIHARSVDVPSVAAAGQAQLERRSVLSPANLALVLFLLILFGAWIVMKPKPPRIDVTANPLEGLPGDKVVVSWEAHDADHVVLFTIDNKNQKTVIYDGSALESSEPVSLGSVIGNESIFAEVSKGGSMAVPELKASLKVDAPAKKVAPVISSFQGTAKSVKIPGVVVFSWKTENAIKVALVPDFSDLAPDLESQTVHFDSPGETDHWLVAWSKDGLTARSEKWRVKAYEVSDADIVSFTATPMTVAQGGTVTVSWNVVNASTISLSYGGVKQTSLPNSGTQQVPVNSGMEFVLVATDSKNRTATKKIDVKLIPTAPANPSQPNSGPADGSTATTGTPPGQPGTTSGPTDGGTSPGGTTTNG